MNRGRQGEPIFTERKDYEVFIQFVEGRKWPAMVGSEEFVEKIKRREEC
jgi:hypothetical protein